METIAKPENLVKKPVKKKEKTFQKIYKIRYPAMFGLKPNKDYFFKEKEKGYSCQLTSKMYIGFPKFLIEKNPEIFERVGRNEL